jgi:cell volume regulation protein A
MNVDILLLGLIILIGFVGNILFKYTKVPESLFMIVIGLVVGPVFHVVDQTLFMSYIPLVSTLTLIIILLDSGFSLSISRTVRSLGKAVRLTLLVLLFSTVFIGGFMYLMGWSLLHALFIGTISSGTTTIVVSYLLTRFSIPDGVRDALILESIFNDVTLITMSVILLQLIQLQTVSLSQIVMTFVEPIAIAVLLGVVFMVAWVSVLSRIYRGEELVYVFTLGVLFILYFLVEAMGGIGALAILVFSLTLGNLPLLIDAIQDELILRKHVLSEYQVETFQFLRERFQEITRQIKNSQINFSFFIKNFFFVYLGIIFDVENLNVTSGLIALGIIALMVISRYVSVRVAARFDSEFKQSTTLMTLMIARGFTATFAALMPSSEGVEIPRLKEITLIMVLLTTLITITGAIVYERRVQRGQAPPLKQTRAPCLKCWSQAPSVSQG